MSIRFVVRSCCPAQAEREPEPPKGGRFNSLRSRIRLRLSGTTAAMRLHGTLWRKPLNPSHHQPVQSCDKGRWVLRRLAIEDLRLFEQESREIVHIVLMRLLQRIGDGFHQRMAEYSAPGSAWPPRRAPDAPTGARFPDRAHVSRPQGRRDCPRGVARRAHRRRVLRARS